MRAAIGGSARSFEREIGVLVRGFRHGGSGQEGRDVAGYWTGAIACRPKSVAGSSQGCGELPFVTR